MEIVKVGEKGQITLPKQFREKAQIGKGDLLAAASLGYGAIVLTKANTAQEFRLGLRLLGKALADEKMTSVDQIVEFCSAVRREVFTEQESR
ncbi:MAG: AbrB/MazE/SpoVT family DNA-binding domain-containing protein [Candidatus Heimdallarchaeota archaeon]